MQTFTIEKTHSGEVGCYRIPGIIYTEDKSIIVYYECRKDESDWAEIDIAMRKSTDGGKSFGERKIIAAGNGKTLNNPIMFADEGKIVLVYQEEYCHTFVKESFDGGETFGTACEITSQLKADGYDYTVIAFGPGHGSVLKSGRYIAPIWLCKNESDPKAHRPSIIATVYSDDKGKTWQIGELINHNFLINPSESVIFETDKGIILNIRNENTCKRRAIAFSENGISNWSTPHFAQELTDPTCEGGGVALKNKLYFTNCKNETKRENLTLSESSNFGKTWQTIAEIDEFGGYSDIATDEKNLFIVYESWRAEHKSIKFIKYGI